MWLKDKIGKYYQCLLYHIILTPALQLEKRELMKSYFHNKSFEFLKRVNFESSILKNTLPSSSLPYS